MQKNSYRIKVSSKMRNDNETGFFITCDLIPPRMGQV